MPIRSRALAAIAAIGLVLAFVSCDKNTPTSPPPQPPTPTVSIVRFELVAPPEIPPGEVVQLTANATKADGSVENVSTRASWWTDSPVLAVSNTGLATAKTRGTAVVVVTFNGWQQRATVLVLPKNTFRLAGTIQDSGFGVANVMVTVIAGVEEGLTTVSGSNGAYALYGVRGPVQINLQKQGYRNAVERVDVARHYTTDFTMIAERPPADYSGTYALTISAAASCRVTTGPFPDAARRRVYTANVKQDVARLTVTLTDADFILTNGNGNRFFGFIDPTDTMTFTLSNGEYYYDFSQFDVVERYSDTALMVTGRLTARGTPQLISGTLAGWILISIRTGAPFIGFSSQCESNTHGFEMVRR